jgi:GT2 family glycosyltransferase
MTTRVTAPRACVAILNFDGKALLDAVLPTVFAQRGVQFDVVVVDNGSTDGSVEHLRSRWPRARVVALGQNVGVTAALNAMVRAAGHAEYVALLNNDVELEPDWLAILIETLEAHPRAAAAAGKLLRQQAREVIDRAGDVVHWSGACFGRGAGELDRGQYDRAEAVFAVGGAAALYRVEAFAQVGLYDEDLFAYLEDVDWGFRARLAGYEARYEPRAVGYHRGGATLGDINPFSLYHLRRNTVWVVVKNWPAGSLLRHGWAVAAFHLAAVAFALRGRQLRLVGRAYRDALVRLPRELSKRRAIQRARKIDPAALEPLMPARPRLW